MSGRQRALALIHPPERRPAPVTVSRAAYELARLRVAGRREPPARFAHLAEPHD